MRGAPLERTQLFFASCGVPNYRHCDTTLNAGFSALSCGDPSFCMMAAFTPHAHMLQIRLTVKESPTAHVALLSRILNVPGIQRRSPKLLKSPNSESPKPQTPKALNPKIPKAPSVRHWDYQAEDAMASFLPSFLKETSLGDAWDLGLGL